MPGTARVISVRQNDLTARARAAADVAKATAAAVDAEARFPTEAFAEIRRQRLLGIQVPQALGGEGASIAVADVEASEDFVVNHESRITNRESTVAPAREMHGKRITSHELRVTNHKSRITSHQSLVTKHGCYN